MRASPSRIMAELREQGDLSVSQAWAAYREMRDWLAERDEKPSLAALERHSRATARVIRDVSAAPEYLDEPDYDFWELTAEYEG